MCRYDPFDTCPVRGGHEGDLLIGGLYGMPRAEYLARLRVALGVTARF